MRNLSSLTPAELRRAAAIQEQIEALSHELAGILDNTAPQSAPDTKPVKTRKKYKLSAEGRAAKIAAQKVRWAKVKAAAKPVKKRRKVSAAGRARIAAAAKARWAKVKAEMAGK